MGSGRGGGKGEGGGKGGGGLNQGVVRFLHFKKLISPYLG